ncbi:hypothetical protein ACFSTE_05920 [Aquimarina hainanensis]|uniref:XRE family transcriptional regulator n=1 Tax=Aquimarina hainanensis TaxID=1578017 RepID=A0ABW5N5G4_9FLAO
MSSIKKRIIEFIELRGISKYRFYKDTGISRGVLESSSGITEDNIAKLVAYYPEINLNWLIKGEGEIENSEIQKREENTLGVLTKEEEKLKQNLLKLLTSDSEIKEAFKYVIGKEINVYTTQKLMGLITDEQFFKAITSYLKDRE